MAKGVRISIDVNELHRLARDLNGTGKRLRQGRAKFIRDKVTGLLEQSAKEAFELEADPETNKRWEEWTEKYRQHVMKLTNGRGHPILNASSALATNNIVTSDQTSAEIANDLPYAAIHQLGGNEELAHNKTMPARPFLGLSKKYQDLLDEYLDEYVKNNV